MPRYTIATTIKSSLISTKGKEFNGFRLYTPSTRRPDELILEAVLQADTWQLAFDSFRSSCFTILDALSLATGAPATWFHSSYVIERDDTDICLIYMKAVSRKTRLPIKEEVLGAAQVLLKNISEDNKLPLGNLRLAIATAPATTKLMLSLFAGENIAGDIQVRPGYNKTDYEKLKSIIGHDLYLRYFEIREQLGNKSIRTALAHGLEFELDQEDVKNIDVLLLRIINYVRASLGLSAPLEKTNSFEEIVTCFEPWQRTQDRADVYTIVAKRLDTDMESIGYKGCEIPKNF